MSDESATNSDKGLEALIQRIEPKLHRVLWRHRIPIQDADDLLQETFLLMVSHAGAIRDPEAWLLATLANRCIIYWRKYRSRLWESVDQTILDVLAEAEVLPKGKKDIAADLEELFKRLPKRALPALRLRYGLGYSMDEVGEIMGVSPASARKITESSLRTLSELVAVRLR